jgi:hypothetical protein
VLERLRSRGVLPSEGAHDAGGFAGLPVPAVARRVW